MGRGVPKSCVIFLKAARSHVTVAKKMVLSPVDNQTCPCRMLLTALDLMSPIAWYLRCQCRLLISRNAPVTLSNLRNGRVAVSNLGVHGIGLRGYLS